MERVIVTSCISTSGKYKLFLGYHIVAGRFCWDVFSINTQTGDIVSRHYSTALGDGVNKAEAYRIYDEYKKKLTAPAKREEDAKVKYRIVKPS